MVPPSRKTSGRRGIEAKATNDVIAALSSTALNLAGLRGEFCGRKRGVPVRKEFVAMEAVIAKAEMAP
jgi:hypothetical protein